MSEERMVFDTTFVYERLVIEISSDDTHKFMRKAAELLAGQLLANGCLLHQTQYDIQKGMYHEVVTVLAAKRERRLP